MISIALLMLVNGCIGEDWHTQYRKANWTLTWTKKTVNQTLVSAVSYQHTVHGCAFWCSYNLAENGVSLYYDPKISRCHCNKDVDLEPGHLGEDRIYYGQLKELIEIEDDTKSAQIRTTVWSYKPECLDLLKDGFVTDGIYSIIPVDNTRLFTFCNMNNGGWTVIQRRFDGSEDFYRNWNGYQHGFGNKTGEYWLGLENIHRLTKDGSEFSVYMEAFPGYEPPSVFVHYSHFTVGDHVSQFVLNLGGFSGNCSDSLRVGNGIAFSTFDKDNDRSTWNCAEYYYTAGWFNDCTSVNFNGKYYKEGEYAGKPIGTGIHWFSCWKAKYSQKSLILKIRKV